jgi:hypothetical protein
MKGPGTTMLRRFALLTAVATVATIVIPAAVALAQTSTSQPTAQTTAQTPTDPGLGLRLLEAPANRKDDPRARRYIVDHVPAGTGFTRSIEVVNGTDRDATISLYAAAASLSNGDFVPAQGRTGNDLSSWMVVTPATVTVPKGGRAPAQVQVAVPADATPGERYAVALAELPPAPGQGLVGLAARVGIRVYLSVGAGSEPPTNFDLQTFEPISADGHPGVAIHSCNTGGRAIDLGGSLTLTGGPGGISAGPFTSTQASSVAPGDCQDLRILLDPKLPRGPWQATASLRSGTKEKTATATITFPNPGEKAAPVRAKTKGTSDSPILAGTAVGLVLLLAGALLWVLLRRRAASAQSA